MLGVVAKLTVKPGMEQEFEAVAKELVAKVNKINPFVKILGATSGVGFLLLAGMMIYSGLNQVQ